MTERFTIELTDVRFYWPGQSRPVLAIEALQVAAGECLLLRGASGSGKTTLLNLLAGVTTAQQGRVSVLNTDLGRLRGSQRDAFRAAHLGIIFQMFNLIPYLSLVDNVLLPCRFSRQRRARAVQRHGDLPSAAQQLLSGLGLPLDDLGDRSTTELSVGQQQRVAAARALLGSPELIIADEPTSALDAETRKGFLQLLFQEVRAIGATLICVSHDPALQPVFDRTVEITTINRSLSS